MDVAEAPNIVFDSPSQCADGRHAEEVLKRELARAHAPGHAWLVGVRIHETAPGALQADGEITDGSGTQVGHREFTGKAADCAGLARAVGVWASLVLDAEIHRPQALQTTDEQSAPSSGSQAASGPRDRRQAGAHAPGGELPQPDAGPVYDENPSRREEGGTVEVGVGTFLMATSSTGVLVGATPFVVIEVSDGVFVRPSIALGVSLPTVTWVVARLDGCFRVSGQYASRRGLQLDLCGGADAGALDVAGQPTKPYGALGPSLDLRGELGGNWAVTLRVLGEVSFWEPFAVGRGELALSWRLR